MKMMKEEINGFKTEMKRMKRKMMKTTKEMKMMK